MTAPSEFRRGWVELDGAANVRDVGGLPLTRGGVTRPGRLLRSDNLQNLTAADVSLLLDVHRVRRVIDLRTGVEVAGEGPGPLMTRPEIVHQHLSLFPETGAVDVTAMLPWQADERVARDRADPGIDAAAAHYLGYLVDRPDSVLTALRSIAAEDRGATLVHCAAGKDRTGVVVAFALTVAGVSRSDVLADYLATADVIDALVGRLRASRTYGEDMGDRPVSSHLPRVETMSSFLAALDSRWGSPTGWLAEQGYGADEQSVLRERLTG